MDKEVNLQNFVHFFGNPGIVLNYYNSYLRQFIDTSEYAWRWKKIDNQKLALSDKTLRQIQHAVRIHRSFFPNADDKLYIQFALQPFKVSNKIRRVRLSINDKQFVDEKNNLKNSQKNSHVIAWPNSAKQKMTSIQLTLANQLTLTRRFPGEWGWFKLVSQSFESSITKKEILLNLSQNENPAKYLLFTEGQYNPFMSLNLAHFHLSQQLTDISL
jgi:type VI protein secretion system component VasK